MLFVEKIFLVISSTGQDMQESSIDIDQRHVNSGKHYRKCDVIYRYLHIELIWCLLIGVQRFTGTPVLHGFNPDDTYRDTQNYVTVRYDTSNTSLTTIINNKTAYLTPPLQDYCSFKYTSAFVGHRGDHLIENIQV